MTDTSGRIDWGDVKKNVRERVLRFRAGKKTGEGTGAAISVAEPEAKEIWGTIHDDGQLQIAFRSELLVYLKRLAEFIEISSAEGLDAVGKEFDVEGDSVFSTLQRSIRSLSPSKTTEFSWPAKRAFQVGSNEWAAKLLRKSDPTKFRIQGLVQAIGDRPEYALVLAPRLILRKYGELLLENVLPGGKSDKKVVAAILADYRERFGKFMEDHGDPSHWTSKMMAKTLSEYTKILTR